MEVGTDLKFVPFDSIVDPSFWHKLSQLKLEVDKLEEKERTLWGLFLLSNISTFHLDFSSFNRQCEHKLNSTEYTTLKYLSQMGHNITSPLLTMEGKLINFNTSEAFKRFDKNSILENQGLEIQRAIEDGSALKNPEILNKFILITFAVS
ncbi:hypothetical protein AAG570_004554 [Ranatra chinensis]|uniref:Ubiquitin-like modifier-activating enzyme Atg7 N-terminal domain-containing protein n=1 Tax=Ranatra chinensis TaxID=642074 RepID=A0ABD0Y171_9HEMI